MGIKETPTNFRVYYKSMKGAYTELREDAIAARLEIINILKQLRENIVNNLDSYKSTFNIDIFSYEEFKSGVYKDGSFLKIAKGLFINRKNNYTIVGDLFDLYRYASKQKELAELDKNIELYNKILKLSLKEYTDILRTFYAEVHRHMILNGEGYVFEGMLGWTCINRCKKVDGKPHIDYAATKRNKEKLIKEGKRLYNKQEAEWCKANGIEYNGVDGRVYMTNEFCYEIPLIGCKLPNGSKYKLEISDYRAASLRGKTNEELIRESNYDAKTICDLPVDVKTKLTLCNSANKMLYLNFIRNENQEPLNFTKACRKNRQ